MKVRRWSAPRRTDWREEASARYQAVAELDSDLQWQQDQYGLVYHVSPYARERIQAPFRRIENRQR